MINGDVMDEGAGNQAAEPALDPPPDHSSDDAMDTAEHPGGEKNQKQDQPGYRLDSEVKEMDKYRIKCPSCNFNFAPSFQFTLEKGRHCEFNIGLQKESKNYNTDRTNKKLELKNQSADIEVKCPICEHSFLYKAIAKKMSKTDGFDIEFSIETPGANDTKGQSKKVVENEDSLLQCTTCKNYVGTSVNFSMEKNGPCQFNICLYNGSDNTVFTSHELTLGNKPASAELNCPKCKQFLQKSYAKRINKRDGFDIELSINKTELRHDIQKYQNCKRKLQEDQLEGRAGDNQPTSQRDFGHSWTYRDEKANNPQPKSKDKSKSSPKKPEQSNQTPVTKKRGSFFSKLLPQSTEKMMVHVHRIVHGVTFGADAAIMKKLTIEKESSAQVEQTDMKKCNVIILFCPVIRNVESDARAAMENTAVASSGKPVILVLMHHTRDGDYSTAPFNLPETMKKVVLYVHVFYHETIPGLLKCNHNDQVIETIQKLLQLYIQ